MTKDDIGLRDLLLNHCKVGSKAWSEYRELLKSVEGTEGLPAGPWTTVPLSDFHVSLRAGNGTIPICNVKGIHGDIFNDVVRLFCGAPLLLEALEDAQREGLTVFSTVVRDKIKRALATSRPEG